MGRVWVNARRILYISGRRFTLRRPTLLGVQHPKHSTTHGGSEKPIGIAPGVAKTHWKGGNIVTKGGVETHRSASV